MASVESDTREAIVLAALALFAKHGIDGVSLRQIVTAAGQSNPSAVHYHFRSKEGLVDAVLDHVRDMLEPLQARALASMGEARAQGTLNVREVMRLFFMPMILMYSSSPSGRMSVRFLSRLTWQTDNIGDSRVLERSAVRHAQVVDILHGLLPQHPIDKLSFLVLAASSNLLHGLADISVLGRQSSLGLSALYQERSVEIIDWFIDYVAAGLEGATTAARVESTSSSGQVA